MLTNFSGIRNSLDQAYGNRAVEIGGTGAALRNTVGSTVGRQLARSGVKGTLAAAAQRQGELGAAAQTAGELSGLKKEETAANLKVNEAELADRKANDEANQKLLFDVLGGVGGVVKNFIPFASMAKGAANLMGLEHIPDTKN